MSVVKNIIGPFRQLLTLANLPLKGFLKDEQLEVLEDAGIVIENGKIVDIGGYKELIDSDHHKQAEVVRIEGEYICLPGFVDAHTHICFAGSRANDFALRNAGSNYLEIARAGGGIWDTVQKTRLANIEELIEGIILRSNKQIQNGVTTCEVKSGYGLSIEHEIKMLKAIQTANEIVPLDLIPTCLAAHIFPKDYNGNIEDYIEEIVSDLFPRLVSENLTSRVDAFIEEEAFNAKVIRPYFKAAQEKGFDITIHADQFNIGGSKIAVEVGALSADHLEGSSVKEIEMLSKSNTIAMALPGASIGLGCAFTPARKLLDAGASVAIASDWNPGSAPMGDLLTQASILASFEKLSNAEVLAAVTYRAAAALNLKDRGCLKKGMTADFSVYETDNYKEITYHQGQLKPSKVWKNGELVFDYD